MPADRERKVVSNVGITFRVAQAGLAASIRSKLACSRLHVSSNDCEIMLNQQAGGRSRRRRRKNLSGDILLCCFSSCLPISD